MSDLVDGNKKFTLNVISFQERATKALIRSKAVDDPIKAAEVAADLAREGVDEFYAETFPSNKNASGITSTIKKMAQEGANLFTSKPKTEPGDNE